MPEYWWDKLKAEPYWLESTDRDDIGADLRAPLTDGADKANWRYNLFCNARLGDVVFHYDKRARAITAWSRIAGQPFEEPIIWAARGRHARDRGAVPTKVPGYRIPLSEHRALKCPVPLKTIREARAQLAALYDALPKGARYFPFELSNRPIRPLQGYAFKLPASFVALFELDREIELDSIMPKDRTEAEIFRGALAEIEAEAKNYAVGGLQRLRAKTEGFAASHEPSSAIVNSLRIGPFITVDALSSSLMSASTIFLMAAAHSVPALPSLLRPVAHFPISKYLCPRSHGLMPSCVIARRRSAT